MSKTERESNQRDSQTLAQASSFGDDQNDASHANISKPEQSSALKMILEVGGNVAINVAMAKFKFGSSSGTLALRALGVGAASTAVSELAPVVMDFPNAHPAVPTWETFKDKGASLLKETAINTAAGFLAGKVAIHTFYPGLAGATYEGLPKWKGNYLPEGVHRATFDEFRERFAFNDHRAAIIDGGMLNALHDLKATGVDKVYPAGSLLTKKAKPGDFDLSFEMHSRGRYLSDLAQDMPVLSERNAMKQIYGGDIEPDLTGFFQRENRGKYKYIGIVEIDLATLPPRRLPNPGADKLGEILSRLTPERKVMPNAESLWRAAAKNSYQLVPAQ